ncbi:gamma-glutamylcyclotransferase [Neomicrococcus aestuarii]|uniref:SH3b domain-containing protein n=1 Tax=Neomicrococcus aestuarii TaxID=556325 RepID=A0A1L2ZQ44_9MICC|nr:gamma-glutamylcyclotransferase [Neomicrococcus aestuarii]APF41563.1 hypothetical protein BHE16_11840 [Neomicrococcus aestuarii]
MIKSEKATTRFLAAASAIMVGAVATIAGGAAAHSAQAQIAVPASPLASVLSPSVALLSTTYATTTMNLHLRLAASSSTESLGIMPTGTVTIATGETKLSGTTLWRKVRWGTKTGWSSAKYLSLRTVTVDTSVGYINGYTSIMSHPVSPTRYRISGINAGTKVQLLDNSGGWLLIKTDKYQGWVQASFVSLTPPSATVNKLTPFLAAYAPPSDFITTTTQAITKVNLHLRSSASTTSTSLGIMPSGTVTTATGSVKVIGSVTWRQLRWGTKIGWAPSSYLTLRTVSTDTSVRYVKSYTSMMSHPISPDRFRIAGVNAGTRVQRLEVSGSWTHIKTATYHGWVLTSYLRLPTAAESIPADVNVADYGRFTIGSTSVRSQAYAGSSILLTAPAGAKVKVTHTAGTYKKITYAGKTGYVLSTALQSRGENTVMAYGTFRSGQVAHEFMAGYRNYFLTTLPRTDMYQLWKPDWTFVTTGYRAVVAEQYIYPTSTAPAKIAAMDEYEVINYQGQNMYRRTMMPTADGSQSWTYRTSEWGEQVAKQSGRLIEEADFLKRF